MPEVVVVTVCWNALAELKLTVESVRSQDYAALRHIVIDGNSTDGTVGYLATNHALFDVAVSEPDRGIYDAMNKAVQFCPDDSWVIFLNAGDRFASNTVLRDLAHLFSENVDFVFGDVALRGADGIRIIPARPHSLNEMPGCHQSTLVRSQLLRLKKFDINYKVGADFDFYLRATRSVRRVAFHRGVIGEIAPEGFSANNEATLQHDYYSSILQNAGWRDAKIWLMKRKLRRFLLRCAVHFTKR